MLLFCSFSLISFNCKNHQSDTKPHTCSKGLYGINEIDVLYLPSPEESILFQTSSFGNQSKSLEYFAEQIQVASEVPISGLSSESKIVLQNDFWGLYQRIELAAESTSTLERIQTAALGLVNKLALSPQNRLEANLHEAPDSIDIKNMKEMTSMFHILRHENAYGLRKLFRIFHSDQKKMMISHFVGIDKKGDPYFTPVIGEVEVLSVTDNGLKGHSLFHLDRRALRCNENQILKETTTVDRIPSIGANEYLFEGPPTELRNNPCQECHAFDGGSTVHGYPFPRFQNVLSDLKKQDLLLKEKFN